VPEPATPDRRAWTLRLPPDVDRALRDRAARAGRSLRAEVVAAVRALARPAPRLLHAAAPGRAYTAGGPPNVPVAR
jgi:plasmid stability protein